MANTYTQIYLHVVFAVSRREAIIRPERREELQKYLTGIVTGLGQKLISIYCMPDHTHALLGLKPDATPSEIVGKMKSGSTNHINRERWIGCRFSWQEGFGGFSISHSQIGRVARYIENQETRHRRTTFRDEYLAFLRKYEVLHDERYIFSALD